jgi:hypothetical protein
MRTKSLAARLLRGDLLAGEGKAREPNLVEQFVAHRPLKASTTVSLTSLNTQRRRIVGSVP